MCALDALAGFEVLVDLEEVLDFKAVELRDVVDLGAPRCALVGCGDTQDLVVAALLVAHAEHAECAAADHAAGEGGFFEEHQCVQGVAVFAQGVVDEPIVVRVAGRGEEHAVETNASGFMINLVFVPIPLGNLDGDIKLHGRTFHC